MVWLIIVGLVFLKHQSMNCQLINWFLPTTAHRHAASCPQPMSHLVSWWDLALRCNKRHRFDVTKCEAKITPNVVVPSNSSYSHSLFLAGHYLSSWHPCYTKWFATKYRSPQMMIDLSPGSSSCCLLEPQFGLALEQEGHLWAACVS